MNSDKALNFDIKMTFEKDLQQNVSGLDFCLIEY